MIKSVADVEVGNVVRAVKRQRLPVIMSGKMRPRTYLVAAAPAAAAPSWMLRRSRRKEKNYPVSYG
jgi:hypothetical protein